MVEVVLNISRLSQVVLKKLIKLGFKVTGYENFDKNAEIVLSDYGEYHLSWFFISNPKNRTNPLLIKVVKEMDVFAGCDTKIVEVPDDVEFEIESGDDGREWVAEKHRTWS